LTESQLCTQLFPPVAAAPPSERPLPDCVYLHDELKRKGVTLMLLWEEYQAEHPEGYRYSHFCELYRRWARTLRVSMRQVHKACASARTACVQAAHPAPWCADDREAGCDGFLEKGVIGAAAPTH